MKIRHILLVLLTVLAIAFMQPLVTFLGGLALLLGVGGLIFRDLSPISQDAVERRILGWLHRVRAAGSLPATSEQIKFRPPVTDPTDSEAPAEQFRRSRIKPSARRPAAGGPAPPGQTGGAATGKDPPPTV